MRLKFFWSQFINRFGTSDFRKNCQLIGIEHPHENSYWRYLYTALNFDFTSADYCVEILSEIMKLQNGEIEKTGWTGNAFITGIYHDRVEIEHQQFSDHPDWPMWTCSLSEFKTALEGWKRFLEMPVSLESEVIVDLPLPSDPVGANL